jgi:hypothetical protein
LPVLFASSFFRRHLPDRRAPGPVQLRANIPAAKAKRGLQPCEGRAAGMVRGRLSDSGNGRTGLRPVPVLILSFSYFPSSAVRHLPKYEGLAEHKRPPAVSGRIESKKNGPAETAAHEVWRSLTSRGEQLLRRHWEETVKCISYRLYAHLLTIRKPIIVQCSHAHAAPRASTQASVPALLSSCTWQRP